MGYYIHCIDCCVYNCKIYSQSYWWFVHDKKSPFSNNFTCSIWWSKNHGTFSYRLSLICCVKILDRKTTFKKRKIINHNWIWCCFTRLFITLPLYKCWCQHNYYFYCYFHLYSCFNEWFYGIIFGKSKWMVDLINWRWTIKVSYESC